MSNSNQQVEVSLQRYLEYHNPWSLTQGPQSTSCSLFPSPCLFCSFQSPWAVMSALLDSVLVIICKILAPLFLQQFSTSHSPQINLHLTGHHIHLYNWNYLNMVRNSFVHIFITYFHQPCIKGQAHIISLKVTFFRIPARGSQLYFYLDACHFNS